MVEVDTDVGVQMHQLCRELFPICRSITGAGLRQSLQILQRDLPELVVHEVPTGTRCFDWEIPPEWVIRDAYIETPRGERICQFQDSNLHVLGYAVPVDATMSLEQLQAHLYSLPDQPDAIPYVTSYYKPRWGFCLPHRERERLEPGNYRVVIDSQWVTGALSYGEWFLPGEESQEIFFSSYLCHPSMANNELSGPVVNAFLARWLRSLPTRRYSYRFVWVPETIGSIAYLSRNHDQLKQRMLAGFNVTCIGDDRAYSYLPSRQENSLADQVARHVLGHMHPEYLKYSYLERGSDERQYCSPGLNLPVCSIMRSKYGCYPEYHTSLDNLDLVTPTGLQGGYNVLRRIIECLEMNQKHCSQMIGEPQLGKRGLYPDLSTATSGLAARRMMNYLAYTDGERTDLEIAEKINAPLWELSSFIRPLVEHDVVRPV